ncbi:MAG: DMT family transporter [Clostridia bacterium]|nr:DMT family transporter [Clostridia bacterium]MDD6682302.1 DMT family transporter [Clostridiales bacterium]
MKFIEKRPMLMIVIGVIGISLSSIFVKYSAAPSAVTAAFRLLWTVLLLSPVALGKKENRREFGQLSRKNLLFSILSGIFLALHFWLWFESLAHTTVASSTTIVCTEVIWVALGFCLIMKGKLSFKAILAIAVTLIGSVLIAYSDSVSGANHLYGDLLALLAAVAVAIYTLLGRAVRKNVSTTVYTYVVYAVCACMLVLISLCQGQSFFAYGISPILVGLLLSVFSTILGHSIFSWCLKYFSPAFVSASKLCEPVVAAILAGFLFGELPTWLQILGGLLILGGVLYYSRLEMRNEKSA